MTTIDRYKLEDLILEELRRQPCFVRVSDSDLGLILVDGTLDLGRLADFLWERLPLKSALPER